ncbi:MAG TPA: SDR family NAD(P)-dependent oxidoreductase [Candidatus Sulfotelmatobacter sp.]|nr:SDR family NAD(P)-dependent oxidoreductase [Candidatus Sulfotelmatobacter sp.]
MEFSGKVALLTGAGSGIGRATARLFADRGGAALIADLNEAGARETALSILAAGGKSEAIRCDVTRWADVQAAVEAAQRTFGKLDVVVHCAGILRAKRLEESTEAEWGESIRVNLDAAFLVTKAALRALREQGGGALVHISSRMALQVKEEHGAYAAAKAGVMQLTRMAALEGAPHGVRVNCVCPGFVDSPMTRNSGPKDAVDAQFAGWAKVCPLGRAATPDDIAKAILFLASEDAAFITGVALPVDGGRTIV